MFTNKKILVTRPASQGKKLCERLKEKGFDAYAVSVMEIEPLKEADTKAHIEQIFSRLKQYDGLIIVSLNAAEQTLPWLARYPLSQTTRIFAVGKTTAQFLDQHLLLKNNNKTIYPEQDMNSEGLLALPALQKSIVQGKLFLILRGVGGREIIAQTLQERGAKVDSCELYRRYMPQENAGLLFERLEDVDVIVINSGESLENLLNMAGNPKDSTLLDKMLLVPSERVAGIARQLKFRHIITAANATDDAVIEAILR